MKSKAPIAQTTSLRFRFRNEATLRPLCINCTLPGTFCGSENGGGEISATATVTIIPQT